MVIFKTAEIQFTSEEVHDSCLIANSPHIINRLTFSESADIDFETKDRFRKFAQGLKKIAPRAKDFLYFSCVMMHAAEAALINQETGEPLIVNNEPISAEWIINKKTGSWKWKCKDPNVKPYKNNNGDIFPESELKKAYRKWIGRPLCKDHQSSSVDGIRGIIVDVYYDDKRKRVIALCALDKVNYPDLARKISTGYANNVSMGTAVGKSICFECGNVAKVEADYCQCVKSRSTYGEINIELSPIELSLVVTGADPRAQLRNVIANLNQYSNEKQERINELKKAGCITIDELEYLKREVNSLRKIVQSVLDVVSLEKRAGIDPGEHVELRNLLEAKEKTKDPAIITAIEARIAEIVDKEKPIEVQPSKATGGEGYHLESSEPPYQIPEDFDTRLASNKLDLINKRLDAMGHALRDLAEGVQVVNNNKEEQIMSNKLRERAEARRAMFQKSAYFQGGGGVNEPQTYPIDPVADKARNEDKQMVGEGMESGSDGLANNDLSLKQKLLRAEMEVRKLRRQALFSNAEGVVTTTDGKKLVPVQDGGKTVYKEVSSGAADDTEQSDIDAAVERYLKAYFQGGGGVNEPQTYPVDPTASKARNEDKQMVGEGMEPGSDGLANNDLSLKQKLLRAKLRAKFVMAFKNDDKTIIDKNNSRWEIYAGNNRILSATGKQAFEDELEDNWENFASRRYGREVLRAIRTDGLDKVAELLTGVSLNKVAQPPMVPEVPAPGIPEAPMPGVPEMPGEQGVPEASEEIKEKAEDPLTQAIEDLTKHLEESEKSLGDLKDALEETTGETEAALPSPAEADDEECNTCNLAAEAAEEVTSTVQEVYSALDESADELAMLTESLESRAKAGKTIKDDVTSELLRLSIEAIKENVELCKDASLIIESAKKDKKEEKKSDKKEKKSKKDEEEEEKKSEKEEKKSEKKEKKSEKEEKKSEKKEKKSEKDEEEEKKSNKKKTKAEVLLENLLKARATKRREMVRQAEELLATPTEDNDLESKIEDIVNKLLEEKFAPLNGLETFIEEEKTETEHDSEDATFEVNDAEAEDMDLDDQLAQLIEDEDMSDYESDDIETTASDRRAWREKIAAEYQLKLEPEKTVETNIPVGKSHTLEGLDIRTTEGEVEGIVEVHNKIMQQVKNLPKVREAMEYLGNLLKSGNLSIADLDNNDKLKSLSIDPAAAQYWKQYWGEGDQDSKQFGIELVQEYNKKKSQASLDEEKIKMRRAYDIALEMQEKGLISDDPQTLHAQVDEIMKFDNRAFESYKLAVSKVTKPSAIKTAAPAIQVGISSDESTGDNISLVEQLKKMW